MNDAIRISSPADILGFIPHTLGFVPRESFVFLTMRGKTLGATLRVDAPAFGGTRRFRPLHGGLPRTGHSGHGGAAGHLHGQHPPPRQPRPFHDHVEAVIEALDSAGTPLQDAWLVTPSHWQNLLCDSDAGCCPPEPLESITDGQLNAELVFRGSSYQKTPGTSYAPFAGPADREEQIRHALPGVLGAELRSGPGTVGRGPDPGRLDGPATAVELLACFQRPDLRDVMFCNVIDPELPDAEESGNLLDGGGYRPGLEPRGPGAGNRPEPHRRRAGRLPGAPADPDRLAGVPQRPVVSSRRPLRPRPG